jgi:GNAT superfamily N-acetyltransferase
MAHVSIRPFSAHDYPAIVSIGNRNFPDYPAAVEEERFRDETREARCKFVRWVAEANGQVVGVVSHDQSPWMYHPHKFEMWLEVDPAHQGRGIGSSLYQHVMAALEPHDPILVRAWAREDYDRSMHFLQRRGFVEAMREWENRLDVASFDPAPFQQAIQEVEGQGIHLVPLSRLMSDPEWSRKLYELNMLVERDVPSPDRVTEPEFETWLRRKVDNPGFLPDAFMVALDDDRYVGTSYLWAQLASRDLDTGLTGTLREYRRRGIALALKVKCIVWAKAHGYSMIKTWNASTNQGMLELNEKLGFARGPAWVTFERRIESAVLDTHAGRC